MRDSESSQRETSTGPEYCERGASGAGVKYSEGLALDARARDCLAQRSRD